MKSMLIGLILVVCMFLLIADTTITFSPFTFKMASVGKAIGWMMLIIGIMIIEIAAQRKGEAIGRTQVIEQIEEAVDEFNEEQIQEDSLRTIKDTKK
jgi:hypothetical protein